MQREDIIISAMEQETAAMRHQADRDRINREYPPKPVQDWETCPIADLEVQRG